MNRRDFLGIATGLVFAPKFGRWYRQGSGLIVPGREIDLVRLHQIAQAHFEEWHTIDGVRYSDPGEKWAMASGQRGILTLADVASLNWR